MTSYVAREDAEENMRHRDRREWEKGAEAGKFGEVVVVEHERNQGWIAHQMDIENPNNPGYDIASSPKVKDELPDMDHPDARYIEVKSTRGAWDAYGVGLSETQFKLAQELGRRWWLYVVEHVDSKRPVVHEVPNPLVDAGLQYRFDGVWAEWAARQREARSTAPDASEPACDPQVGKWFKQMRRTGQTWTFRVEKIWFDQASGRRLAQVLLATGQTQIIQNLDNWESSD